MRFYRKIVYVLSVVILCLTACVSENIDMPQEDENSLKITVTDGGYVSAVPLEGRTVTDGYSTTFTDGDVIGVFTVVNGQIKQNNVGMIYSSDINGWAGLLKKEADSGVKYFAYYPWRKDLKGQVDPSAENAEGFFAGVVKEWELPTDQGNYKKYTSADLMTAQGTVSDNGTLEFTMQHQMGLVIIQMPMTKYVFSNTDPQLGDYFVPAAETSFNYFDPCMMFDGTYRYLIKPRHETAFSGSYKKDGTTHSFSASPTLSPGTYKKYNVDGGTVTEIEHTLQVGDYLMKDGSLIAEGTVLGDDQKAMCLGIVFWVGNPTETDLTLKTDFPNCMHGLACSLRDGNNVPWQYNNNNHTQTVQHWVAANSTEFMNMATGGKAEDNLNRIQGYNNTKAMEFFNSSSENSSYKLEIALHLNSFKSDYPTPLFTSGWYIPSVKELFIMFNDDKTEDIFHCFFPSGQNYKLLNGLFKSFGEYADTFNSENNAIGNEYYSSSENNVYRVWCVGSDYSFGDDWEFYETFVTKHDKAYIYHSRFVLAF